MSNSKLWIFGSSLCLPYGLDDPNAGWDSHLAQKLQATPINLARAGADNLFIFASILDNFKDIGDNDTVIVGWSHPSRKTFVIEDDVSQELAEQSEYFQASGKKFYRNKARTLDDFNSTFKKLFSMKPKNSGIAYYDKWFSDYYSEHEQKLNFQSYLMAIDKLLIDFVYIPFYFSKNSVDGIFRVPEHLCQVDFVYANRLVISDLDAHMNEEGHKMWAEKMYIEIKK
jgi:hypothetical protein